MNADFNYCVLNVKGEDVLFINSLTTLQGLCLAIEDALSRGYSIRKEQDKQQDYYFGKIGNCYIALDVPEGLDIPEGIVGYKGKWTTLEEVKANRIQKELETATWYNGQQNPDWNGLMGTNFKASGIYSLAKNTYGIDLTDIGNKASDKPAIIEEFKSYFKKQDDVKSSD